MATLPGCPMAAPRSQARVPAPIAAAATAVVPAMAAAVATESGRVYRGVVVVGAERARSLKRGPSPIVAADLIDRSGDFRCGDWLYVTSRGHDGGQSVLATGAAAVDFDQLAVLDAQATVVDGLELLWGS